jgi:AhpC/TSA family protein
MNSVDPAHSVGVGLAKTSVGFPTMRKTVQCVLGLWLLTSAVVCPQMIAQAAKPEKAPVKLKVGDVAPDFKMQYFDGHDLKDVSLSQYRGKKNVVLAFYIFAFTGG